MEILFAKGTVQTVSTEFNRIRPKFFGKEEIFCSVQGELGVAYGKGKGNLICFTPLVCHTTQMRDGNPRAIKPTEIHPVIPAELEILPRPLRMPAWAGPTCDDCLTFLAFGSENVPTCEMEAKIAATNPVQKYFFGSDRLLCFSGLIEPLPQIDLTAPNGDQTRVYYCLRGKFPLPRLSDTKHPHVSAAWQKGFAAQLGEYFYSWKASTKAVISSWLPQGECGAILFVLLPVLILQSNPEPMGVFSDVDAELLTQVPRKKKKKRTKKKAADQELPNAPLMEDPHVLLPAKDESDDSTRNLEPGLPVTERVLVVAEPGLAAESVSELESVPELCATLMEEEVSTSSLQTKTTDPTEGVGYWRQMLAEAKHRHTEQLAKAKTRYYTARQNHLEDLVKNSQNLTRLRRERDATRAELKKLKLDLVQKDVQLQELQLRQNAQSEITNFIYVCEYVSSICKAVALNEGIAQRDLTFAHIHAYFTKFGLPVSTAHFVCEWLSKAQDHPAPPNVFLAKTQLRRSMEEMHAEFEEDVFMHFWRVFMN
eukprot:TRINITY_DN3820_c0_g2_i1.p1 TRINITY_DN3820_c0_g2~~TRINITY_DN3820_c0_g2_i1.p1  ORF type:complete len:539 (-),score=84.09 TRINITY_DN3820_c0_g2_i1:232-1848(-)